MSNVAAASLLIQSLPELASSLVPHLDLFVAFPLCNRSNQQENQVHNDPNGSNTGRCRVKRRTNC